MLSLTKKPSSTFWSVLLLLALFTPLYYYTLYPEIGGRINFGDSAKWQFLWAIGGTPHSPGYPLFLLLTTLFGKTLLFLEPPLRIMLLVMLSGLGAIVITYFVSKELISGRIKQLIPPLLFGSSITFWGQSTEAEVYSLNALFIALVSLLFIRYSKHKERKYLLWGSFVYAISFGNHLTMIALLPGIIYLVFVTNWREYIRPKTIGLIFLFIAIGFSQYFYLLYLSHQGAPNLEYIGENATLSHWFDYITAKQWSNELAGYNLSEFFILSLPFFIQKSIENLGIIGLLLGLHGLLLICYRQKFAHQTALNFLALMCITQMIYCLSYRIPDIEVYFIPIYLFLSFFIAIFINSLHSKWLQHSLTLAMLSMITFNLTDNMQSLKEESNTRTGEFKYLFPNLPDKATLYIPEFQGRYGYSYMMIMKYYQYVARKDKQINVVAKIPEKSTFYLYAFDRFRLDTIPNVTFQTHKPGLNPASIIEENKNKTIIFAAKGEASNGLTYDMIQRLKLLGLNIDRLQFQGSYAVVIDQGNVISEQINNEGAVKLPLENLTSLGITQVTSQGLLFGNEARIEIAGKNYSPDERGLNIVIFDPQHKTETQAMSLDTFLREGSQNYQEILQVTFMP